MTTPNVAKPWIALIIESIRKAISIDDRTPAEKAADLRTRAKVVDAKIKIARGQGYMRRARRLTARAARLRARADGLDDKARI